MTRATAPTAMTLPSGQPRPTLALPRPASVREAAILNHPDQRTAWIVVVTARLAQTESDLIERLPERLRDLAELAPIVAARWHNGRWWPGEPPVPLVVDGDPLAAPDLLSRFRLDREPPVRVVIDRAGQNLALAAHHSGLDGRGMVAVIGALLGHGLPDPAHRPPKPEDPPPGISPAPATTGRLRPGGRFAGPLGRLARPADRVAPSARRPSRDAFARRQIAVAPPNITGQVAEACVGAAGARNAALGAPWRRIGLSIPVAGPLGIGNQASYRRVDLAHGEDVAAAVHAALLDTSDPPEMVSAPRRLRLLAPVADRFSDSLLISNLGYTPLAGVSQLCLFPVARGRSAVSIAASSVERGRAMLTARARDIPTDELEQLLDDIVHRLT